ERARAVADALAALQVPADRRMRLPALEFLERAQPWIGVVQSNHEADRDLAVVGVVQERTAVGAVVQRPAGGVHHQAGLVRGRIGLPQLLDADAVALRIATLAEPELLDQPPTEMPARAFGEDRVLRQQLHAQLELGSRLAVLAQAEVAG